MKRLPQMRLVIAGDGPQRGELHDLVKVLRLDNVAFVGHVRGAELESVIAESRFTVLPSHAYETLGKTILESYAEARAVVASDLGRRRELVQDGETGLLYPTGDVERLTEALKELGRTGTCREDGPRGSGNGAKAAHTRDALSDANQSV